MELVCSTVLICQNFRCLIFKRSEPNKHSYWYIRESNFHNIAYRAALLFLLYLCILYSFPLLTCLTDGDTECTPHFLLTELSKYKPACASRQLVTLCPGHNSDGSCDMWRVHLYSLCNCRSLAPCY